MPRRQEDVDQGVSAWSVDEVNSVARRFGANRIVLAPDHAEGEAMLDLVRLARESNLKVTILPRVLEVVGSEIEPDDLDGMTVLAVRHSALSKSSKALKRGFDLIGASLALLVLRAAAGAFSRSRSGSTREGRRCSARRASVAVGSRSRCSSSGRWRSAPTRRRRC